MTVDLPIAAAASLVLSPLEASLVGFLGAFDTREFTREIAWSKTAFNRSQIGLLQYSGAFFVHSLAKSPAKSPHVILLSFASLAATVALNYTFVGTLVFLEHRVSFGSVIRRLRLGMFSDFALSFVASAVLGAMLAVLCEHIGWPALIAFLGPIFLSRQAIIRSQMVLDKTKAYESRERVLAKLEHQIYQERSDERRLIAADLHDEVLQPLFKVSLMAHVLKADLASGRLLEIDADLPELLTAAEAASETLRGVDR